MSRGLRFDEHLAKEVVEASNGSREFQVRDLVVTDRHHVGVVERDVGRLQQRIPEETNRRQIAIAQVLLLFLVGRHPFEPRHRHHHRQQQKQLGVLGDQRLNEQRAALRVDASGNPVRNVLVAFDVSQTYLRSGWSARASPPRNKGVELGLQRNPVVQGSDEGDQDAIALLGACPIRHGPSDWTMALRSLRNDEGHGGRREFGGRRSGHRLRLACEKGKNSIRQFCADGGREFFTRGAAHTRQTPEGCQQLLASTRADAGNPVQLRAKIAHRSRLAVEGHRKPVRLQNR